RWVGSAPMSVRRADEVDDVVKLVALPAAQFAAVVALFLPGFVSLKVDRLIQPATPTAVGEMVIEAFAYSLINAGLLGWVVLRASIELSGTTPNYLYIA